MSILRYSIFCVEIIGKVASVTMERQGNIYCYHGWLGVAMSAAVSVGFQHSLTVNVSGRNHLIPLSDLAILSFYFIYFLASFVKLSGDPFSFDLFLFRDVIVQGPQGGT